MVDVFFLNSQVVVVNRIEVYDNNIEGLIINYGVYNYVINVIKYGFLRKIFILFIRSGDGICQIRYWKYVLLVYDLLDKIKYRFEFFFLLVGVNVVFLDK